MDFETLRQLGALSSTRIESLDEARAYVRKSAALCGLTDAAFVPDDLESRLAAAELEASREPSKLVSDDQVAEAFNFMSDEFRVVQPARLTASDILQYRSVMSAIFPYVFSPKSMSGSRPVGAIAMLYTLVYNGGITEGVRKLGQGDYPPGSLKVDPTSGRLAVGGPSPIETRYLAASRMYFGGRSSPEIRSFLSRLTRAMGLSDGGQP